MRVFYFIIICISTVHCPSLLSAARSDSLTTIQTLLIERIEEMVEGEAATEQAAETDIEQLEEYYAALSAAPLNVNSAGRGDLERLLILTPFQIESLLDYRAKSGRILSLSELALLHGFDNQVAALLRPYITFGPIGGAAAAELLYPRSELYLRAFTKLRDFKIENQDKIGAPFALLAKYKFSYGDKYLLNITAENDIGERLFGSWREAVDFLSLSLKARNVKVGSAEATIILGDFSARFGQGLILWNAFSFGASATPQALYKRGAALLPYTSAAESNFFRGAALTLRRKKIELSLFGSFKKRDARVENGECITLYDDGLHDTQTSLAHRKTLAELVAGVNLRYTLPKLKAEISHVNYLYNARNVAPAKANFSLSLAGRVGEFNLFGEVATDYKANFALLAGGTHRFKSGVECGLLLRYYPAGYSAPYAGAYSSLSQCYNQAGGVASLSYTPFMGLSAEGAIDYCYYPKPRYNIAGPSAHLKSSVRLTYTSKNKRFNYYLKVTDSWFSATNIYSFPTNKLALTIKAAATILEPLKVEAEWKHSFLLGEYSRAYGLKASYSAERLSVKGGLSLYNATLWSNRLYIYESELPATYGGVMLYGKGLSGYILLKHEIKKASLYTKFSSAGAMQYIKFGLKLKF